MATATEIYIWRNEQGVEEAELEYTNQIEDKDEAEADAVHLCRQDSSIRKIAYFKVRENGSFRRLLTYENPNYVPPPHRAKTVEKPQEPPSRLARARRQEESLWTRLIGLFARDGAEPGPRAGGRR